MESLSDEGIYIRLGLASFQIENYGHYDPNLILEIYWGDRGRKLFEKYKSLVKSKICKLYNSMKESGLLEDFKDVYLFIMGYLIANDVPRAIAAGVAALVAKQGLHSICKE